jgi:hypothetical protein
MLILVTTDPIMLADNQYLGFFTLFSTSKSMQRIIGTPQIAAAGAGALGRVD